MIGLDPEERTSRNEDASTSREPTRLPKHDDIEDVYDDEDYEDWLFL
jgi:hypothetical protein